MNNALQNLHIGAVTIGRNEGDRLKRCLKTLQSQIEHIVYVDSGSGDDSVLFARSMNVEVVELDMSVPFTAARARNMGMNKLLSVQPELRYVQFLDGDCELQNNWINEAVKFLDQNPDYAVVCGRRRERFPEKTVYNQLCDIEWDTPVGDTISCGGDALIRVEAFAAVNGYDSGLIAGEEPEMCFRLRQQGWKIMRLDAEMTLHDADMTKFSQWWKRNKRAGHAYAESFDLHGKSNEKFRYKECKSILIWAAFIPITIILLSIQYQILSLLFLIYPLQIIRLTKRYIKKFNLLNVSLIYATSNVIGKWPQLSGLLSYFWSKLHGKHNRLIEYK